MARAICGIIEEACWKTDEQLDEKLIEKTKAKKLLLNWPFIKISFLRSRNGFIELNAITSYTPEN